MAIHFSILPGESNGQRSLVGYSPWGLKSQRRLKRLSTHAVCSMGKGKPKFGTAL